MCLSVVGIANSPQMGGKRTASPPGGHIGPPVVGITNSQDVDVIRMTPPTDGHMGIPTEKGQDVMQHSLPNGYGNVLMASRKRVANLPGLLIFVPFARQNGQDHSLWNCRMLPF